MLNFFVSIILLVAFIAFNKAACDDQPPSLPINSSKLELAADEKSRSKIISCGSTYSNAKAKLAAIELKLHAVETIDEYEKNIKERFLTLQSLDTDIAQCKTTPKQPPELTHKLQKISDALQILKSNSQTSAFTSFKDWVESKEKDLEACKDIY